MRCCLSMAPVRAHTRSGDSGAPCLILHAPRYVLLTGDDNVHFLNSMELTNQLVQNQILFDMMAYPNQQHGLSTNGAQDHIWRLLTRQVFRKLAPSWIPQIPTTA